MPDTDHMDIQVVQEEGESLDDIARELIGPKGMATYRVIGIEPGCQWPTIRFFGTKNQLGAIRGKSEGNPIGYPSGRTRSQQDQSVTPAASIRAELGRAIDRARSMEMGLPEISEIFSDEIDKRI